VCQVGLVAELNDRLGETVSSEHLRTLEGMVRKGYLIPRLIADLRGESTRHFASCDEPYMSSPTSSGELFHDRFRQREIVRQTYPETGETHTTKTQHEIVPDVAGATNTYVKKDVHQSNQ